MEADSFLTKLNMKILDNQHCNLNQFSGVKEHFSVAVYLWNIIQKICVRKHIFCRRLLWNI